MIDLTKENIEFVLNYVINIAKLKGALSLNEPIEHFCGIELDKSNEVYVNFETTNYYSDKRTTNFTIDELLEDNLAELRAERAAMDLRIAKEKAERRLIAEKQQLAADKKKYLELKKIFSEEAPN